MTLTPSSAAVLRTWVSAVPSIDATMSALAPLLSIVSICEIWSCTLSFAYCRSTL